MPNYVAWIDIYKQYADPEEFNLDLITEAIRASEAKVVDDPFIEDTLRQSTAAQKERLEKNWIVMQKVADDPYRLFKHGWDALYKKVINKSNPEFTQKHFYKLLRQFLQRGQNKNALKPDFYKQGAPKLPRNVSDVKIGRKRIVTVGTGIPITNAIKEIFRIAIDRYYLRSTRMPWTKVHEIVEQKFRKGYPSVSSADYPTVAQLKHFFKMEYEPLETAKARSTDIGFEKDVRQLTSTATAQVLGPGDRFEFDATIIDLYLVSEKDPSKIIGRPTLLIVIDVFSRLITGYYLTFEPPSYVLAMMSLANCLENKVDVCRLLGIKINFEDWPAIGLPTAVLADKGELLTHQADSLVNVFNTRIENAKARRGDAKGIVERKFRTLQADFKPYAPGVVTTETAKKRGGKDYRLDATLTLRKFEEIIVLLIYKHNLKVMSKYDADEGIPDELPRTSKDLWQWGIENRSGALKSYDVEQFKILTLPRTTATVSNEGIKYESLTYSCSEAFEQGWFIRDAHRTRPEKVEIGFDPRTTNKIYVFPKGQSTHFWVALLTDRSRAYKDMTFYEAKLSLRLSKLASSEATSANKDKQLTAEEEIQKRIESASKRSKQSTVTTSNNARLKTIKENKKEALSNERKNRAVGNEPQKEAQTPPNNVKPFKKQDSFTHPDIPDDIYGDED
jgi:hypothetical protein